MTSRHISPNNAATAPVLGVSQVWEVWEETARRTLVDAMQMRGVGYKTLSRELEKLGIYETPGQLNRKVNRRKFSVAFLLACFKAMNVEFTSLPPSD